MAPTSMEVKVMCCKDIKAFNFFQKLSIYSSVSIVSTRKETSKTQTPPQRHKTPIDREGKENPEWNHLIQLDLSALHLDNQHDLFLEFDMLCDSAIFGDKSIGQVRVPIKELIEECNGTVRYVSYQVMTTDGKPNGVLDFSYKVIDDQFNKIGSLYPEIESIAFHQPLIYPPPLPTPPEVYCPSPGVFYPQPLPETPHFVQAEFYYPPSAPLVYGAPTGPYGYPVGNYSYPVCGYPTNDGFWPRDESWRREL
ncbi:hypothetical protein IFM89_000040 [Coptis chinensis]|uniref:C2 domain-containing protein n=1 Tax=Coptis chinensis TaxID=261450 RepID=A0A835IJ18_9MAGN|nr:hypothetical protein IFM89_000040 [Coptis chinensis]